ncbi:MAG: response regulator [Polyangiaceae bacterium]|nr:response regulator [Polyangiaceae bacterium]
MASMGRVLVVDDEAVVCAGIGRALVRNGYEVDTALEASLALEKVQTTRYDVLLVDIMMPRMNGLALLERLREKQRGARALVITGLGAASHAIEAFRVGAFDFITKPFTTDELLSATMRAATSAAERCALERPSPPAGTYLLGTHSWVRHVERNLVTVGVHHCFQQTAGRFVSVDLPNEGDELVQGELCARVRVQPGAVYTVWNPVSGRVVEANLNLMQDPTLANADPYGEGWLVRLFDDAFEEESRLLGPPS